MDIKPDSVDNFEAILKQHTSKQPTRLYSSIKNEETTGFQSKIAYNPKDIIRNISAQIKAIQNADGVVTSISAKKVLEKHKTSSFVPVNELQTSVVPQTKAAKFETQFVLDTQLMNVIEDVEAMSSHKGITQEFESIFDHTNIDLINRLKPPDSEVGNGLNDSRINSSVNVIKSPKKAVINSKTNIDSIDIHPKLNVSPEIHSINNNEQEITSDKTSMDDHCTALLDRCIEIEENVDMQDLITDTEINASPIINISTVNKSNSTSPLVFDLNSFEKFEQIALPIINENKDIDTVKHLINSQIIGNELFIHTDFEPDLSKGEESVSPVLKITKTPKNNTHKEDLVQPSTSKLKFNEFKEAIDTITEDRCKTQMNMLKSSPNEKKIFSHTLDNCRDVILNNSENKQEKKSVSFEDEILFSSDEENDIKDTNIQDLPFTCALQTSFYEHSDVLDTTMYVGFQTASNKSIQVSTVSFTKAKSILDDEIESKVKVPTLKELVEKCDTSKSKITFISGNTVNNVESNNIQGKAEENDSQFKIDTTHGTELDGYKTANRQVIEVPNKNIDKAKSLLNDIENDYKNSSQDAKKFDGFKTASNKCISLSEKALQRCKRVFQDIDLDENFRYEIMPCEQNEPFNKKMRLSVEHDKVNHDTMKTDEKETRYHDIPKIDEDILQEFEGEMSFNDYKEDRIHQHIDFKSSSNKTIKISDEAFEKSNKISDVMDDEKTSTAKIEKYDDKFTKDNNANTKHMNFGYKTASSKIINISEKALARTKTIFQDIDVCDSENTSLCARVTKNSDISEANINENINENFSSVKLDGNFVGFKTASNKLIKVSEDAISKSKNIFQGIECEEVKDYNTEDKIDDEMIKAAENIDFNKPFSSKENFVGFRTANNKKIVISDAALEKTKNIFKDLDNLKVESKDNLTEDLDVVKLIEDRKLTEEFDKDFRPSSEINEPCCTLGTNRDKQDIEDNQFKGFQTAGYKSVKLSKEALLKSKTLFRDILNENPEPEEVKGIGGFHTASNKKIEISDVALARSKKIFENLEKIKDKNTFQGFQIAGDRSTTIPNEALGKSKMFFKDLDICDEELDIIQPSPIFESFQTTNKDKKGSAAILPENKKIIDLDIDNNHLNKVENDPVFKGFQTASKKEIKISNQALAKSRKIFEDLDKADVKIGDCETNNKTPAFKGFQTASNKKVAISSEALAKSRKMFDDLDRVEISKVTKSISNVQSLKTKDNDTSSLMGFQTASNEKIEISAAALEKSKKKFEDIDVVKENDFKDDNESKKPFLGFQTANNKEVKVSDEALTKSKELFDALEKDNERAVNREPFIRKTDKNYEFVQPTKGFHTASNKEVNVSAEALAKIKKIFQNHKECKENEEIIFFKGFQTGSNKKVLISEEALAKSRHILSDIRVNENTKPTFSFTTANNNNIQISEEALFKSRQSLAEKDQTQEDIPNSCVIKLRADKYSKLKPEDKYSKLKPDLNIEKLIDTQVIKNFDESLNTEDFKSLENRSKRSGSPILSCPRAKKKKFATPYKKGNIEDIKIPITKETEKYDDSYKKHKKYTLKDISRLENINTNAEVKIDIDLNAVNLSNFEFTDNRNDISNSKMSSEELKEIFFKSVNKKLIPDGWYEIHVKLILWKLISYEMKFPKTMSGICTAKNVLLQLKYRYHKELYSAERPAIRKILEKDDVPSKMLVLCVMEIFNDGGNSATNPPELLLTDGWYTIRTCLDKMLAKYVNVGKIRVGTKLVTHGAELVNCENGIAPWEDTSSVRLKIFGNSTRRARWDARLGYHSNRGMVAHLPSLKPEGGKVSILRVLVTRVYPPLYVEKFEDGSTVTRSERLEHIHQMKYEADRQALVEKVYEEVEEEMSDEESPDTEDVDISKRSLDSGSQIARLLKMSKEPSQFRANLTESQRRLLEAHTASKTDKILQDIQERIRSKLAVITRNVVPLLKIRVAELHNGRIDKALLSIWKPNDAISELITEGAYVEILNVVPTSVRYSELQLSAGRQTIFKQTKKLPENLLPYIKSLNRNCYPIKEIVTHPTMVTDYNEIDTVGMIIQIDPTHQDFKNTNQFQNVYLTDEEKNIICVNFWGGIKKFGFENVLDTGQIVACVNLQKRAGNTRKNIPQYRATEFTYFTKTPKSVVARKLVDELSKNVAKNKGFIEECLVVKDNLLKSNISNEISPYRFHNHDLSKNKIYIESPLARIQPKIQDEFNLSGLDFESTFRQTDPQELSPKSLLRKRRMHEKISKLKMYGEPPPLSPINIINKSKNATKSFKSPLLNSGVASKCDTPVANVKILPESKGEIEINCSPVLRVNRTFKKSVNPVKLDFNKVAIEENDSVDHFAEDFDASPPLSLD